MKYQKMKNKTLIWISALFSVLIFALLWADSMGFLGKGGQVIHTDTIMRSDTVYLRDTLTLSHPLPYVIEKVRIDTVYTQAGDTIELLTETKKYEENIIQGEDTATIKAQITGINAELDTLSVMFNRREVANTIEITKYLEKKKKFLDRFHISPNISAGYGLINRKPDIYVGIGVSYEF